MAITVRIPLQTSKRKAELIDKGIDRQQELAEFFDKHIKSFPKEQWGGRPTKAMRNLPKKKDRFGRYGKNRLAQSHYKNQLFRHISDIYRNVLDGHIEEPDFSEWDNFVLCNCGGIKEDGINRNNSHIKYDLENDGVRISLLDDEDPQWFRMRIGDYQKELFERCEGTGSDARIVRVNSRYELHQSLTMPEEDTSYEPESYVGVDFNFDRLAVASFLDEKGDVETAQFHDYGRELRDFRERQRQKRKELQEEGLTGRVEENRNKVDRMTKKTLHTIARNIVRKASDMENPVIKVEDTGIQEMREEVNDMNKNWWKSTINRWAVGKLIEFIEYKAEMEGIKVKKVNPRNTSKKCHKCGEEGRRPDQRDFYCKNEACNNFESRIDADMNAALNIAKS